MFVEMLPFLTTPSHALLVFIQSSISCFFPFLHYSKADSCSRHIVFSSLSTVRKRKKRTRFFYYIVHNNIHILFYTRSLNASDDGVTIQPIYNFFSWAFRCLPLLELLFRSTRAQLEPPCFPAIMTCAVKSRRKGVQAS